MEGERCDAIPGATWALTRIPCRDIPVAALLAPSCGSPFGPASGGSNSFHTNLPALPTMTSSHRRSAKLHPPEDCGVSPQFASRIEAEKKPDGEVGLKGGETITSRTQGAVLLLNESPKCAILRSKPSLVAVPVPSLVSLSMAPRNHYRFYRQRAQPAITDTPCKPCLTPIPAESLA